MPQSKTIATGLSFRSVTAIRAAEDTALGRHTRVDETTKVTILITP